MVQPYTMSDPPLLTLTVAEHGPDVRIQLLGLQGLVVEEARLAVRRTTKLCSS